MGDIVDVATEAGSFKTLLEAATAAGLVETLKGEGPFTVFAPTDEAFAALPEGTLEGLLKDPEALKQILLYHVVSGKVTADQVVDLTSADSVAGPAIKIAVKDGKVMLNDSATVVTPDVDDQERRHPRHRPGHPAPGKLTSGGPAAGSLPPTRTEGGAHVAPPSC